MSQLHEACRLAAIHSKPTAQWLLYAVLYIDMSWLSPGRILICGGLMAHDDVARLIGVYIDAGTGELHMYECFVEDGLQRALCRLEC